MGSTILRVGPTSDKEKYIDYSKADAGEYIPKSIKERIISMALEEIPKVDCKYSACWKSSTNENIFAYSSKDGTLEYIYNPSAIASSNASSATKIRYSCSNSDGIQLEGKQLLDNQDGTLTDPIQGGLVWRRCAFGKTWNKETSQCVGEAIKLTWNQAIGAALKDNYNGVTDWRVPTKQEYSSLLPNKCKKCDEERNAFAKVFKGYENSSYWWGDAHWTSDNSSDLQKPVHVNFMLTGLGCFIFDTALRPFAEQPVMLVRGGEIPTTWKDALAKLPRAEEANEKSRRESEIYWTEVNRKIGNFIKSMFDASASGSPTAASTPSSSKNSTSQELGSHQSSTSSSSNSKGVKNLRPDGNSIHNTPLYQLECNNGRSYRIFRSITKDSVGNFKWTTNGSIVMDAAGYMSTNEYANAVCATYD
jgi:hypothetical protein